MSYSEIEKIYKTKSDEVENATAKEKNSFIKDLFFRCSPIFVVNILESHPNLLKQTLNSNIILHILHPNNKYMLKYLDDKNKELYGYSILNTEIIDEKANTIPMIAVKNGNINVLKECIANGYDITRINSYEDNILSLLFEYECEEDIVSNFKNKVDNFSNNMIFYDEEEKNIIVECMNALVEADNEEEKYEILKEYAKYEYNHFVDFLLSKNIDLLNAKNTKGISPLLIAAKNNSIACDTIFKKPNLDFNTIDRNGNNILMLLIQNNNIDAINDILDNNENIPLNMVNKQGLKVTDLAIQQPTQIIKRMLDNYTFNIFRKAENGIPSKELHIQK